MKDFWTDKNLNKVTNAFLEKGEANWCELCKQFNISPGTPQQYILNAYYTDKPVADHYDVREASWYDEKTNEIIIENPFPVAVSFIFHCDIAVPATKFIKLDAEEAMKILVLGLP